MTALPPYLKRGDFHCCCVYFLLSLPSLNHPAQLIVVASVYLIMAERHVLRMGRRGYNALSSGDDYRTTSSQFALQRLLLWRSPLSLPLLILKCHKYITLIVARVRRSQSALVCQALLHRRFLLSVTDRQYAGLLAVPIIPAKRYHTILLRRDSDRRIICRCASTRRAAARRFSSSQTHAASGVDFMFKTLPPNPPKKVVSSDASLIVMFASSGMKFSLWRRRVCRW